MKVSHNSSLVNASLKDMPVSFQFVISAQQPASSRADDNRERIVTVRTPIADLAPESYRVEQQIQRMCRRRTRGLLPVRRAFIGRRLARCVRDRCDAAIDRRRVQAISGLRVPFIIVFVAGGYAEGQAIGNLFGNGFRHAGFGTALVTSGWRRCIPTARNAPELDRPHVYAILANFDAVHDQTPKKKKPPSRRRRVV
jgi:hypothetical protein